MNKEGYSDRTAEQAIANVMREERIKKKFCNVDMYMANKTNMEKKMEKIILKEKECTKVYKEV